ncbi:MAG: hypothetical protein ACREJQ_01145 [bacterium]
MKRPLGIKITALMFFLLGSVSLIWVWLALIGWGIQDIAIPTVSFFSDLLPPLSCLILAGGIFFMKRWGQWISLSLTALIAYYAFEIVADGSLYDPALYRISQYLPLAFNVGNILIAIKMWILVLLPFVAVYFLVFDKATVAAFRTAPGPPVTPSAEK